MKIGVLGAGLMGREAVRDLLRSPVEEVGLSDLDLDRVREVRDTFQSDRLRVYQVDAGNEKELADFMRKYDVVINALFYSFNEVVAKTAIKTGVSSVDLGGHIGHITDKVLALHEEAKKAGVTIIPDLGVAPGMINIMSGYGASKLDEPEEIRLYVGGIPVRPEPPLEYNHVFSMEGVLDHYTNPSLIIREGKKQEIPSLSEVERIYFDRFGPLEAFHTSGGTSTLSLSYPNLKTLEYKTIRYPGHAEKFKLLVDLNLTRTDYHVELKGQRINPREVFLKVVAPFVELGDKEDVILFRAAVSGKKSGQKKTYRYEMTTFKDTNENITAMARATANTISVAAQMIANGTITKRGVYPPEKIVPGDLYMKEMAKRDVIIEEKVEEEK